MVDFSGKGYNILAGLKEGHSDDFGVGDSVDELFVVLENVMLR
jgi:hypothetical protein